MGTKKLFHNQRPLIFDGAMGTLLQRRGLKTGVIPETLNLTHPEIISSIHKDYVNAGADVITANTFGANAHKLGKFATSDEVIAAAIKLAKDACEGTECRVALDVGPIGMLLEPMGTLSFDEAYDLFKEQMIAGQNGGADIIIIETMSDMLEAKAAVLAAKENTDLPIILSMSFNADCRTFMGVDAVTAAVTASSWGIDCFGVNCSFGPQTLMPTVEKIIEYSSLPVIVQANAGLPCVVNGETLYSVDADEYAEYIEKMLKMGVSVVGGCCGTDPSYIEKIATLTKNLVRKERDIKPLTAFTGSRFTAFIDGNVSVIGERINPTGKKAMQAALRAGDMGYVADEAVAQEEAGAAMLDVNGGLPDIDEPSTLLKMIKTVQGVSGLPLVIDSSDPVAVEAAVRRCNGKPVINSVNGSEESLSTIIPIAAKYGTGLICLTLDEKGIPKTAEERLEIAHRIYTRAIDAGIKKENLLFDLLTLTASTSQDILLESLEGIRLVKERYGVKTVLGVSNVSFGLPSRPKLNSAFLLAALGAGLDAPILNPLSEDYADTLRLFRVLNGEDKGAATYIEYENTHQKVVQTVEKEASSHTAEAESEYAPLIKGVIHGQTELCTKLTAELLKTHNPLDIINSAFIPALDKVGEDFETGRLFIPQLMASADAVKAGFDLLKSSDEAPTESRGKILMATVKGDVHDIGKNIVKMLLSNYGYEVIDLGKDVEPSEIVEAVKTHGIKLVGLSALMTTTVKNMKVTIDALKEAGCDCKVMVGGAVLTPEYAKQVGADFYAKDASEAVKIALKVME